MSRPVYLTTDGHEISVLDTSRHHILWTRNTYHTSLEKRFRQAGGLVLRLEKGIHRQLHDNLSPPPKPSAELMQTVLDYKKTLPTTEPYETFEYITEFLGGLERTHSSVAVQAGELYENFTAQQAYVDLGRVSLCM